MDEDLLPWLRRTFLVVSSPPLSSCSGVSEDCSGEVVGRKCFLPTPGSRPPSSSSGLLSRKIPSFARFRSGPRCRTAVPGLRVLAVGRDDDPEEVVPVAREEVPPVVVPLVDAPFAPCWAALWTLFMMFRTPSNLFRAAAALRTAAAPLGGPPLVRSGEPPPESVGEGRLEEGDRAAPPLAMVVPVANNPRRRGGDARALAAVHITTFALSRADSGAGGRLEEADAPPPVDPVPEETDCLTLAGRPPPEGVGVRPGDVRPAVNEEGVRPAVNEEGAPNSGVPDTLETPLLGAPVQPSFVVIVQRAGVLLAGVECGEHPTVFAFGMRVGGSYLVSLPAGPRGLGPNPGGCCSVSVRAERGRSLGEEIIEKEW